MKRRNGAFNAGGWIGGWLSWAVLASSAWGIRFSLEPPAIQPGDVFVLSVMPNEGESVRQVRASILGVRPVFHRFGSVWKALAAVHVKTRAGRYPVYVKATLADGREVGDTLSITVKARKFPRQNLRVSPNKKARRTSAALRRDYARIRPALAESAPRPLWDAPFLQPVKGRISTDFGTIRAINGQPSGRHYGIDIAAPKGTPVRACSRGRVVLVAPLEVHGNTIILDHGCQVFSIYLHLSKMLVKVGQEVQKGQIIGEVGATGFATASHLHWGIKVGSISVNPWRWLRQPPLLRE